MATPARYVIAPSGKRRAQKPSKATFLRLRRLVYERDRFTCQRCGYVPTKEQIHRHYDLGWNASLLQLDHIVPYAAGGDFVEDNLQALCEPCNRTKGARV